MSSDTINEGTAVATTVSGTQYCTIADVRHRLSEAGVMYCADDDDDGSLSATEEGYVVEAIVRASEIVNEYLAGWVDVPLAVVPDAVKHLTVDIAAEELVTRRGAQLPQSLLESAVRARERLEEVRQGKRRVTGLTYPTDSYPEAQKHFGRPRVANP